MEKPLARSLQHWTTNVACSDGWSKCGWPEQQVSELAQSLIAGELHPVVELPAVFMRCLQYARCRSSNAGCRRGRDQPSMRGEDQAHLPHEQNGLPTADPGK